jgi:hypothetical protein
MAFDWHRLGFEPALAAYQKKYEFPLKGAVDYFSDEYRVNGSPFMQRNEVDDNLHIAVFHERLMYIIDNKITYDMYLRNEIENMANKVFGVNNEISIHDLGIKLSGREYEVIVLKKSDYEDDWRKIVDMNLIYVQENLKLRKVLPPTRF